MRQRQRSKSDRMMTHRGTVTGAGFGRSRIRLRDNGGRWWVSTDGIRFSKKDGACRTENSRLLIETIEKIPKPHGVYEEILMQRNFQ